ncbi:hypothetical protein CTAYLR_003297 [Chrysophaeum taylorii]|uniref:Ammonium transporter AmtB-like domain-containing protein n=1 Tax=Chrysophaeum taylorii TaxID=2483200 RepID=A0AAD7UGF7_9STRA|nr:hypothetical protein CTAYLR_003297 [Chrysophaeum taylorii]
MSEGDDIESASTYLATEDADAFWLLFGMALVFFMQAGFAMLEAGSVHSGVVGRVLLKNVFDASFATLLWWATGYSFAYGTDNFSSTGGNGVIGVSGFFYESSGPLGSSGRTYSQANWLFQWAFAGVAATIVSGAVAGRCQFVAYVAYAVVISGFVYPVVVHIAWSEDGRFSAWRSNRLFAGCGVVDFAGSGVVHMTGGLAALIMTNFLGARRGRFPETDEQIGLFEGPGESGQVFQTLGALILWFGWYAFNGVSTLAITGAGGLAAHTMFTTTLSAATGCLATTALSNLHYYLGRRDPVRDASLVDVSFPLNGILAGLVSITAGCAVVSHWGAAVIGLVGSFVYYGSSRLLVHLKIDDVVDAFPVHGACGAWGVIGASLFATDFYYDLAIGGDRARRCKGLFYGGTGGTTIAAVCFVLTVVAWLAVTLFPLFYILHTFNLIAIEDTPVDVNFPDPSSRTSSSTRFGPPRVYGGDRAQEATVVPTFATPTSVNENSEAYGLELQHLTDDSPRS